MHLDEKQTKEWHPWARAVGDRVGIWLSAWDGRQERRQWKRGDRVCSNVGDSGVRACNWIGKGV